MMWANDQPWSDGAVWSDSDKVPVPAPNNGWWSDGADWD